MCRLGEALRDYIATLASERFLIEKKTLKINKLAHVLVNETSDISDV